MKNRRKVTNVNKVVFNCQMMDLIKLRIVVDANSNVKRVPVDNKNIKVIASNKTLKKVLKSDRHK